MTNSYRQDPPTWAVYRVHDKGKKILVRDGLTTTTAHNIAGRMRDALTDREIGLGWDVQARYAGMPTKVPRGTPLQKPKFKLRRPSSWDPEVAYYGSKTQAAIMRHFRSITSKSR